MLNTPFSPWPNFADDEVEAVVRVLRSNKVNYWTGTETREFEKEYAQAVGSRHALALANGTLALDMALRFLVEPGDDVIVTPRTFIASVSSVIGAGCRPVFADVDRESQNISAETISAVLTPKTKAIVVVHLAGMPADMDPIMELAKAKGLKVIEDCSQAHGASYKGRSVGTIGDVGTWSFCQDKIITTGGEGGMLTLDDSHLWDQMWSYKDHGKSQDAVYNREHGAGFRWVHDSFGTNWRMTEMQSAIGRVQLQKLPRWQAQRLGNAERIWETCRAIPWLRVPDMPVTCAHAAYKVYVFVEPDRLPEGVNRDTILQEIAKHDIPVYSGSCSEVYLEKAFEGTGFAPENRLPVARELGETSVMFLCHPTLTYDEIESTCTALIAVDNEIRFTNYVTVGLPKSANRAC